MKRVFTFLVVLSLALVLLPAESISWKWRSGDDGVKYFRYRVDEGEWKSVESESYEVRYDIDSSVSHTFEIQQSYDGFAWSESKTSEYVPYVEYVETYKVRPLSRYTVRINAIPQQNVTVRSSNTGVADFYAEYSAGAEFNATTYFNKFLGFGFSASINGGLKKLVSKDTFLNFGVYAVPSFRIVANESAEISIKAGAGVEIEPYNGTVYMSPSFIAQVDANIFFGGSFALAISPSVIYSRGDFLGGSSYNSTKIRLLSIGAAWGF